ncbi:MULTISPECIES: CotH kinase family protein [Streptomyces]|nr:MULTISPECIES: CotH kinase family protein [Streptomyces]OFA49998.1 hypothetical protein BEN35_16000 [Streptomyces fradiae]
MRRRRTGGAVGVLAALSILLTGLTGLTGYAAAGGEPAPPTAGPPGQATTATSTVGGGPAAAAKTVRTAIGERAANTTTITTGTGTTEAPARPKTADDLSGDITFSVPSGTFEGEVSVTLDTAVTGAEIRYTTDGTLPTADSPRYSAGAPLRFTTTTQLRAQSFADGAASGEPGTAMYIARSIDATHDLPVMVMDAYGAGAPGRDYQDVATLLMEPVSGSASLGDAPAVSTRAAFHLRGQSSATFEKAPYRLELRDNEDKDADHAMLGMPAESDWVLRGPFSDKSLIHDAFAYSLGRDIGMQAPRFEFVELYVNTDGEPLAADDYRGVYMLVETIKVSPDRLDITPLRDADVTEPAVTGGYVFAFEWFAAEEPTLPCTGTGCWQDLEVKVPSSLQPEQRTWLTEHVRAFHDALRGPEPSDPRTGYPAYIDVGSFIDQIIVNELTREMDSYIRSQYFHKDRGGRITAGPLWDYDLSFGTGGYFENHLTEGWQFEQTRQPVANDWFIRLMADPAFARQAEERWQELRRGPLSDERLNSRIDALAAPLGNAARRNFERWPNLTDPVVGFFQTPTADTWEGQVEFMRDWMTRRVAWLDTSGWQPGAEPAPERGTGAVPGSGAQRY